MTSLLILRIDVVIEGVRVHVTGVLHGNIISIAQQHKLMVTC